MKTVTPKQTTYSDLKIGHYFNFVSSKKYDESQCFKRESICKIRLLGSDQTITFRKASEVVEDLGDDPVAIYHSCNS